MRRNGCQLHAIGNGKLIAVWVAQLARRQQVLILLLVEVARRDVVAALLLLVLVADQLVLYLRKVGGMRQGLLAAVRVQVVVCRRRIDVGVEWALANTRSVWCAPAAVELEGSELNAWVASLAIRVDLWSVRTNASVCSVICSYRELHLGVAVA